MREIRARSQQKECEDQKLRFKEARDKARYIWQKADQAPDTHPYLVRKHVKSHGLKLYKGSLIIPLKDEMGTLHSLQFIDAEGNKRFLKGGRKKGCFFTLGSLAKPFKSLCLCEGYATGASIYEACGDPVAICFDSNNLKEVAQALRKQYPDLRIILCADNDESVSGNPGLSKAKEAASSIGGFLSIAQITDRLMEDYRERF